MKFRDKSTGAVYEPTAEVAAMMAGNPNLEPIEDKKPAKGKKTEKE